MHQKRLGTTRLYKNTQFKYFKKQMSCVKIPAILSTVPDLSSVVILKQHRENRAEYFLSNLLVFWMDNLVHFGVCVM